MKRTTANRKKLATRKCSSKNTPTARASAMYTRETRQRKINPTLQHTHTQSWTIVWDNIDAAYAKVSKSLAFLQPPCARAQKLLNTWHLGTMPRSTGVLEHRPRKQHLRTAKQQTLSTPGHWSFWHGNQSRTLCKSQIEHVYFVLSLLAFDFSSTFLALTVFPTTTFLAALACFWAFATITSVDGIPPSLATESTKSYQFKT